MTIEEKIEAALFDRVHALGLTPALPVAWPNMAFTPPAPGGHYLRVDHLPNVNSRLFMKGSAPHRRQGILQLTVVMPLNQGAPPATAKAGQVAEKFPADLRFEKDSVRVRIQAAPDVLAAVKTDVSWDLPVSIRYEAFA